MPGSGGPYRYLSEAYGPKRLGRLMSFLFIWETIFLAPVSIGAGAVGFAQYTKFLWPHMGLWQGKPWPYLFAWSLPSCCTAIFALSVGSRLFCGSW